MFCQVCGGEPDEDDDGLLWLLPQAPEALRAQQGGPLAPYPPICAPCLDKSLRMCPPLRAAHSTLRVRQVSVYGVIGQLWAARTHPEPALTPVSAIDVTFCYQDDLSMVLAYQQVIQLTEFDLIESSRASSGGSFPGKPTGDHGSGVHCLGAGTQHEVSG
jgi:hypothetical protein